MTGLPWGVRTVSVPGKGRQEIPNTLRLQADSEIISMYKHFLKVNLFEYFN